MRHSSRLCEHTGPNAACKPFVFEAGLPKAWDITPDGSVVAGSSDPYLSSNSSRQAVRWIAARDPVGGVRSVPDYLAEEHGLDFDGWTATFAYVNEDGTVMYGERVKDYVEETWVAYLPEPGGAGSLAGGVAFLSALRRRRSRR